MDEKKVMDLSRSVRATRGKRMTKLLNEEIEADETFWSQDALKEDAGDDEYKEEEDQVDEFDSDFDDDELDSNESVEDEDDGQPAKKKKKQIFIKRSFVIKKKVISGRKNVSVKERSATPYDAFEDLKTSHLPEGTLSPPAHDSPEALQEGEGERAIRKSTRMVVIVRQAERDALRALQPVPRSVKKKKGFEEERRMTQKEMLQEAAQTEFMNLQSLERMLAREEEVKMKAVVRKILYSGPKIRFHSVHGRNVLQFTEVNSVPAVINSKSRPYPAQSVCVVTGLSARYRDPKTGLPYSTKDAFKIIRERLHKDEQTGISTPLKEATQMKRTKAEKQVVGAGRPGRVKLRYIITPRTQTCQVPHAATFVDPRTTFFGSSVDRPASETPRQAIVNLPLVDQSSMTQYSLKCQPATQEVSKPFSSLDVRERNGPFLETNEADFLLEDLEVSLLLILITASLFQVLDCHLICYKVITFEEILMQTLKQKYCPFHLLGQASISGTQNDPTYVIFY